MNLVQKDHVRTGREYDSAGQKVNDQIGGLYRTERGSAEGWKSTYLRLIVRAAVFVLHPVLLVVILPE